MQDQTTQTDKTTLPSFYRLPQVQKVTGLSAATIWRKVKAGEFVKPVKASERVTCWPAQEVHDWVKARITESRAVSAVRK
jgi:prophage regulatory protein